MRSLSVFARIVPGLLSAAAAVSVLAGCSGIVNSHTQKEDMMSDYDVGDNASAKEEIVERLNGVWYKPWKRGVVGSGDELMWRLEAGSINFHEGNFEECIEQFKLAEGLIEEYDDRARLSITDASEEFSVLFTNLNALPYRGLCRDRMALSIYKSLAYLGAGREDSFRAQLHILRDEQKKVQDDYKEFFEIEKAQFDEQEKKYPEAAKKYKGAAHKTDAEEEAKQEDNSVAAKKREEVSTEVVSGTVSRVKVVAEAEAVNGSWTEPPTEAPLIVAAEAEDGSENGSLVNTRTLEGTDVGSLGTTEIRTVSLDDLQMVSVQDPGSEAGSDAGLKADSGAGDDAGDEGKAEEDSDTASEPGSSAEPESGSGTGAADEETKTEAASDDLFDAQAFFDPKDNKDFMDGVEEIKKVANRGYGNFLNPAAIFLSGLGSLRDGEYDNARIDFQRLYEAMPNNPMFKRYYSTALKLTRRDVPDALTDVKPFDFPLDRNCVFVIFANGRSAAFRAINVYFPIMTAWPVCEFYDAPFQYLSAQSGGSRYDTCILADMDGILAQEYDERLVGIVARIVLSTFIKETSYAAALTAIAIADMPPIPKALALVGTAVGGALYRWVVNTADTRSWEMLPKEFQLTQFPMPEDRKVILNLHGENGVAETVALPEICKSAIIFVDAPSPKNIAIHVLPLTSQ